MNLIVGKAYFSLGYSSDDAPIPEVETYIFIGKDIFGSENSQGEYFFQTPWSYFEHGSFAETKKNKRGKIFHGHVTLMRDDAIETLLDFDGLLTALGELKNDANARKYLESTPGDS